MTRKCGLFFTTYAAEDRLFPTCFTRGSLLAFLAVLATMPLWMDSYLLSIMNLIFIAAIGAAGLNILTGACGQISLGHGAFIGVGAYASAISTQAGMPFLASLVFGGLAAAATGMIFGIPSLRLKGIYLAIATLAAQLILEYVFLHWESVTGGSNGLPVDSPTILGYAFDTDAKMFYLMLGVAVPALLGAANIMRTKYGRAFVSIRDYHLSAEVVGVGLFGYKLAAFGVSSFLAGMAGCLWGHYTMYITPEQFGIMVSVSYLAMIIIGGLGSVLGSVMGAVFITLLPEVLNLLAEWGGQFFPDVSTHLLALKEGVFGLVLILFLIFEPEGLVHRWRLVKAYWKLYPFAY